MKIGGDRIILLAIGFEKVLRIIVSLEVEPKPYGTPPVHQSQNLHNPLKMS